MNSHSMGQCAPLRASRRQAGKSGHTYMRRNHADKSLTAFDANNYAPGICSVTFRKEFRAAVQLQFRVWATLRALPNHGWLCLEAFREN